MTITGGGQLVSVLEDVLQATTMPAGLGCCDRRGCFVVDGNDDRLVERSVVVQEITLPTSEGRLISCLSRRHSSKGTKRNLAQRPSRLPIAGLPLATAHAVVLGVASTNRFLNWIPGTDLGASAVTG
jgi:hypothetical protein